MPTLNRIMSSSREKIENRSPCQATCSGLRGYSSMTTSVPLAGVMLDTEYQVAAVPHAAEEAEQNQPIWKPTDSESDLMNDTHADADIFPKPVDSQHAYQELEGILKGGSRTRASFTGAWMYYNHIDDEKRSADITLRLLEYLIPSDDQRHAEQCAKLFQSLKFDDRTPEVYRRVISAYTQLQKIKDAEQIHDEAMERRLEGDCGLSILLVHAIRTENWDLCLRLDEKSRTRIDIEDFTRLWQVGETTPDLGSHAIALAQYAEECTTVFEAEDSSKHGMGSLYILRRFARRLFRAAIHQQLALDTYGPLREASKQRTMLRRLFVTLETTRLWSVRMFEETLQHLLSEKRDAQYTKRYPLVRFLYSAYRRHPDFAPSQRLTYKMLKRLCQYNVLRPRRVETDDAVYVNTVIADERALRVLSLRHYRLLISFYAARRDVGRVEEYLTLYHQDYPQQISDMATLRHLIYVRARRADVTGAEQAFNRIKDDFKVVPDLPCWNVLLYAYAKADDLEGALECFERFRESGMNPDQYTFAPLLEMYGKRGNIEGAEKLLSLAQSYPSIKQPTTSMLNGLVNAHTKKSDMTSAEELLWTTVEDVRAGRVLGSLTRLFNTIITSYAIKRDINSAVRIFHRMKAENIPLDNMTYAALMKGLIIFRQTQAAHKILTVIMKKNQIQALALHYAIVMVGYVNQGMYAAALGVHELMLRDEVEPTLSTQMPYLKAKAFIEHQSLRQDTSTQQTPLVETVEEQTKLLNNLEASGSTMKQPPIGLGFDRPDQAEPSAYFDFLIYIHGYRHNLESVQELFQRYRSATPEREAEGEPPPIKLLAALMFSYLQAGEHAEVETCWNLVRTQADVLVKLQPVPKKVSDGHTPVESQDPTSSSSPTRTNPARRVSYISPARRLILTRPCRFYIRSLAAQNLQHTIPAVMDSLLAAGFQFDNRTWNAYVQLLCSASPPYALRAFQLTEAWLMPPDGFPGWQPQASSRAAMSEGLQHIRRRYLAPGGRCVQYDTMVQLLGVYLDLKSREAIGGSRESEKNDWVGTTAQIKRQAPTTWQALRTMPRTDDKFQRRFLSGTLNA
ncbi:hypothetical protein LTR50_005632 [Elasticomyces elasticus]|nr:hypothetical protein LTR50_005632 [Elasticomyces elasticus]